MEISRWLFDWWRLPTLRCAVGNVHLLAYIVILQFDQDPVANSQYKINLKEMLLFIYFIDVWKNMFLIDFVYIARPNGIQ